MWLHHLTFPVTVNNVNTVYVAGDVCELENEKYIAWQMVVSLQQLQQRVQKINSNIQTLGDKIKQTNIFISPTARWGGYSSRHKRSRWSGWLGS